MKAIVATLLALLATIPVGAAETPVGASLDISGARLEASVKPEKPVYQLYEEPVLLFRIENRSDRELMFGQFPENPIWIGRSPNFSVEVTAEDGQSIARIDYGGLGGGSTPGYAWRTLITPGGAYEYRVQLSKWYRLKQPGTYGIKVTRRLSHPSTMDTSLPLIPGPLEITAGTRVTIEPDAPEINDLDRILARLSISPVWFANEWTRLEVAADASSDEVLKKAVETTRNARLVESRRATIGISECVLGLLDEDGSPSVVVAREETSGSWWFRRFGPDDFRSSTP